MASIGTNSIRVYHVDPAQDHDGCMSAFESQGIYVWLDLDTFPTAIVQTAPTWDESQFGNFTTVMDTFIKYDNLAGFWIGNEVINTASGSIAAPYIKAATADMKSYMAAKNYRTAPIGYSAADIAELRPELQNYLACGSDYSQSIDFYGLNAYEWCGPDATYQTSGYVGLQALAEGYNIPIFFSETGCIVPRPRTFADQAAIFGPDMIGTWSGAIVYEWVQETNDYGLVTYPGGQIYSGAPIPIQPDYDNLAGQWKNINPSGVAEDSYSPSFSAPACPGPTNGWAINGNVPLPTLGSAIVQAEAASVKPTPSPSSLSFAPTAAISSSATGLSSSSSFTSTTSGIRRDSSLSPTSIASRTSTIYTDSSSVPSSLLSQAIVGSGIIPHRALPVLNLMGIVQLLRNSLKFIPGTTSRKLSTVLSKRRHTSDLAPYTTLSNFSSTAYSASHKYTEKLVTYTMSSGSIPVSTMTLIIPTDKEKMTYASEAIPTTSWSKTTSRWHKVIYPVVKTKTIPIVGPSWVQLDSPIETGSTSGTFPSQTTGK